MSADKTVTSENDNDSKQNTQRKRILVIEDEKDIAEAIKSALKSSYRIDNGGTGFQAIRSYKPRFYDLILLDYRMPNMDGSEFYQEIKKIDPNVKVCFITAYEEYHTKIMNKKWKINQDSIFQDGTELPVLKKPFDTETLKAMVSQLIGE